MAHTDASHAPHGSALPVEGDGISYRGIVWFVAILTATTVFCALLMVILFRFEEGRSAKDDLVRTRAPLALPANEAPPPPNLLYMHSTPGVLTTLGEPTNLANFRAHEETELTTYGWVDKNAGTVRIPIEKAKELLLQKGLQVRK